MRACHTECGRRRGTGGEGVCEGRLGPLPGEGGAGWSADWFSKGIDYLRRASTVLLICAAFPVTLRRAPMVGAAAHVCRLTSKRCGLRRSGPCSRATRSYMLSPGSLLAYAPFGNPYLFASGVFACGMKIARARTPNGTRPSSNHRALWPELCSRRAPTARLGTRAASVQSADKKMECRTNARKR